VVHAVGLSAAVVGAVALIAAVAARNGPAEITVAAIYAFALVAMLTCSAAYNLGINLRCREVLRRLDLAAIYVMIAGTYTPFTAVALDGPWAVSLTAAVWVLAALGVALTLLRRGCSQALLTGLYLAFGWIGILAARPFLENLAIPVVALLVAGGVIYTAGTIVFSLQRVRYQRAIWHGFVVAAATVHFSAVFGMILATG
jgi:hemolysin III